MQGEPTEPGYNPYQVPPSTAEAAGGATLPQPDTTPEPFKPELSHQTVYEPLGQTETTEQPGAAEVEDQAEVIADLQRRLRTAGRRIQELTAENEELRAKVEAEPAAEKPKAPEYEMVRDIVRASEEMGNVWLEGFKTVRSLISSLQEELNQFPGKVTKRVEPAEPLDEVMESKAKAMLEQLGSQLHDAQIFLDEGQTAVLETRDRVVEVSELFEEYPAKTHRDGVKKDLEMSVGGIERIAENTYIRSLRQLESTLINFDSYLRDAAMVLAGHDNKTTVAYRTYESETQHMKGRLEKIRERLLSQLSQDRKASERAAKKVDAGVHKLITAYPGTEPQV